MLKKTPLSVTPGGSRDVNLCVASQTPEDFTAYLEMHPLKQGFLQEEVLKKTLLGITRICLGALAGNVGICVCRLHPSNDRHFCLSPACRQCRPDTSATFCYVGQFQAVGVVSVRPAANTHSCIQVGISTNEVVTQSTIRHSREEAKRVSQS